MEDSFKERGLLKVALPRERITPLMIIQQLDDSKGEIIGSVEELFSSTTTSLPLNVVNEKVADFFGDNTAQMDMKAGLSFLQSIWSKLGKGELGGSYNDEDVISFHFSNLLRDSVKSEILLSQFIYSSLKSMPKQNLYRDALKNGDLYIVTSVLKSNDLTITVEDCKTKESKLNLGLKDILNLDANGGSSSSSFNSIKSNDGYMIFALRAKKIIYREEGFLKKESFSLEEPDDIKVLAASKQIISFPSKNGMIDF